MALKRLFLIKVQVMQIINSGVKNGVSGNKMNIFILFLVFDLKLNN
jgi:hypothetical protein